VREEVIERDERKERNGKREEEKVR
jgi:hypothetical protein